MPQCEALYIALRAADQRAMASPTIHRGYGGIELAILMGCAYM
jgi:hypothetical protein